MPDQLPGVLVLCTGNSARSILGEAMLAQRGGGRLRAYSAGSQPKGVPHPGALRLLARRGIDTAPFRSKSWNAFTGPDAPRIDIAITVCGNAAQEACPVFMGGPDQGPLGPARSGRCDGERGRGRRRFRGYLAGARTAGRGAALLPFRGHAPRELADILARIGRMDGAA